MATRLNLRRNPTRYVLFGILLILIGILMLISPGTELQHGIIGTLVLAAGLTSIAYVNRLVIDRQAREIVHQRGLILPLLNKRYAMNKVRGVRISEKTVRKGDKETTTYPIALSGIKGAILSRHHDPWFSRVLAEQLARLLDVPLINRVYGRTSTRQPGELDMPLMDRWTRDDERFERPSLAHITDLRETMQGASYELSMRAEVPRLKYVVALLYALAVPAVLATPLDGLFHSAFYRISAVFFLGIGTMMLALIGRSNLKVSGSEVSFRQGYSVFRSRIAIRDIEEMVIAADGITLIGDANAVWIHWGSSRQDSAYLEAVVPYQIARLGRFRAD